MHATNANNNCMDCVRSRWCLTIRIYSVSDLIRIHESRTHVSGDLSDWKRHNSNSRNQHPPTTTTTTVKCKRATAMAIAIALECQPINSANSNVRNSCGMNGNADDAYDIRHTRWRRRRYFCVPATCQISQWLNQDSFLIFLPSTMHINFLRSVTIWICRHFNYRKHPPLSVHNWNASHGRWLDYVVMRPRYIYVRNITYAPHCCYVRKLNRELRELASRALLNCTNWRN